MMPLTMARTGETVTVLRITGKDSVRQHLTDLGFVPDAELTVVSEIAGSLILQIKGGRVALDKSMAGRIMVQEGWQKAPLDFEMAAARLS